MIVVPDVIAHHRNTGDNLLVLEAKKVGNPEAEEYDRMKIRALKEQQEYHYAVFLRLRTGPNNPGIESVEWLRLHSVSESVSPRAIPQRSSAFLTPHRLLQRSR